MGRPTKADPAAGFGAMASLGRAGLMPRFRVRS